MDPNVFQVDQSSFNIHYTSTFTLPNMKTQMWKLFCWLQAILLSHTYPYLSFTLHILYAFSTGFRLIRGGFITYQIGRYIWSYNSTYLAYSLSSTSAPLVSSEASQYWHCLYPESGDSPSLEWIFWQVATWVSGDIATTISQLSRNIEPTLLIRHPFLKEIGLYIVVRHKIRNVKCRTKF